MENKVILWVLVLFGIIALAYRCMRPVARTEHFADTLGLAASNRYGYDNCLSECNRQHPGDIKDTGSWTQLLCERRCNAKVEKAVRNGTPDMTPDEYNRHTSECAAAYDQEKCACYKEIASWCASSICPNSSDGVKCRSACESKNAYNCTSGLYWSWRP